MQNLCTSQTPQEYRTLNNQLETIYIPLQFLELLEDRDVTDFLFNRWALKSSKFKKSDFL